MEVYECHNIFTAEEGVDKTIGGYIIVENGIITAVETGIVSRELRREADSVFVYDGVICPGFVDSHTHLMHGGSRENELAMKLQGKSYMEIHKSGGGINSTVKKTREIEYHMLWSKAQESLDQMLIHGTTTVESKSGYGLDMNTELKCLRMNHTLNKMHPIDIVSTYMGAHSTPPEYKNNKEGYIQFMINEVMPKVKEEELAEFVDVFCEDKIFSVEESERILQAAKDLGFRVKVHADEIVPFNGAELAAKMKAISAEHLMAISDQGIKDMAEAGTVAVLLPATSFFLMSPIYAPAKKMIEAGVRVALATDFNPGSSPTENIQMPMFIACYKMGLTPAQILRGVTLNAAYAIGREKTIGSIEVGKQADFVFIRAENLDYIIYHFGVNAVERVYKKGKLVVENKQILYREH